MRKQTIHRRAFCKYCGKSFIMPYRKRNIQYCTVECQRKARAKNHDDVPK